MPTTPDTALEVGKLCVGGDWACASGDLSTLRHIVERLATYTRGPLHCELIALADACGCDPHRATAAWPRIKDQMYQLCAS